MNGFRKVQKMAKALWKISLAVLLVFGSGRASGKEVCFESKTKEFTCSEPVLTFNNTGQGIDLALKGHGKGGLPSLPIPIHQTPRGLNISSVMIPDEGKVEFRIKENFVEVKNAGSWESVFKGEKGKIGFYKFSAPPDTRICVTCNTEDIFDKNSAPAEIPEQNSTPDHHNTEQNIFTTENRDQDTLATENGERENTSAPDNREQNPSATENREQNTFATENTEHRKSGGIVTAASAKEEDKADNRSWWWLLLIPACFILAVYLFTRHRQSSRYSVRRALESEAAERKGDGTPGIKLTNEEEGKIE